MIKRVRSALSGLAALAALVLLVIGMPVVLYRFGGSPLPSHLAGWQRIVASLASRDDGTVLLSIIRVCSWLAWLLFTACVLTEAQAALRGRRAPHLRLGGLQGAAAQLVALSALAFTATSAITLSSSAADASQLAASSAVERQPGTSNEFVETASVILSQPTTYAETVEQPSSAASQPAALAVDAVSAGKLVTVRPGDCLWSLAERYLGSGERYPEIVRLNYGHQMGNGEVFTNPELIEPGWRLLMPMGATHRPDQPTTSIRHLGHPTADQDYRRRHLAAARHSARMPAQRHRGREAAAPESAATVGSAGSASEIGDSAARTGIAVGRAGYQTPASTSPTGAYLADGALFITGALAGAVLSSLSRMRHRQRQNRRRGRRISLPAEPAALATEQRLRAVAPAEPLETLRDALACLEGSLLSQGLEMPDIVGLHVTPQVLEVLLAAPAAEAPPAPFTISPGRQGMCWQLELPATVSAPALGRSRGRGGLAHLDCYLLPGLITAGATDAGFLLLDLEALQIAGCDGPPDLIDHVVVTLATELATGQWSGWYELILVGCDELVDIGRAEHCLTFGEALDLLTARRATVAGRIAERAPASVRELRQAEPHNEDWGLTILVSRVEPSSAEMTCLIELAEDGPGGIAALVAGDPEANDGRMAPTVMQLAPDPERSGGIVANVVPFQITVRPRVLSNAEYDAIGSLLASAADLDDIGKDEEPYLACEGPPWIKRAADSGPQFGTDKAPEHTVAGRTGSTPENGWPARQDCRVPEDAWVQTDTCQLEDGPLPDYGLTLPDNATLQHTQTAGGAASALNVKILGPFTVTGTVAQLQPKQAELVLALMLAAPAGLSNSALCAMLGADPDHPKPGDAVRQIITRTRRRLGLATDGQEYIIHAGNGQYVMHPSASLDWSRFRELVASGRADDLRAALSLITGQPFSGSYYWWIDIPLIETVRAEIVDAAEMLAEFELTIGSPRAAGKAARAGLMAEPSAEQLWRVVMRAEHAAGNLAGVAEAWRRCLDAIEDIAPGGEPHPDTATLYRQLTESASQQVQVR
jgi:DNA-binding SARP family transcriptional activator